MSRIGIVSRHIVLTSLNGTRPRHPMPGVILILDELIDSVHILSPDFSFDSVKNEYPGWDLRDYQDFYVSPGIIDLNVRREWEDLEQLTKAAISGGVTLLALEAGYYVACESSNKSYCDIANVCVIDDHTDFSSLPSSACALKGYLFPPSSLVKSVAYLQNVLSQAFKTRLPVLLDSTLSDPRMLYMASPMRLEPLEDRKEPETNSSGLFAAAFPENMNNSEDEEKSEHSEEDSEEDSTPVRSTSLQIEDIKKLNFCNAALTGKDSPQALLEDNIELSIVEVHEAEESSPLKSKGSKKKSGNYDIYNDLDNRIRASQQNILDLCIAEKSTYSNAGSTQFLLDIPKKPSSSFIEKSTESDSSEPSSASLPQASKRRELVRPKPIQIKPESTPDTSRDYKYHLANYPEHWESTGVDKVIECLSPTSKVHFQGFSSAVSLNKIRQLKSKFKSITCEIPAVHLYFTSASVKIGDTRYKNTPPIRNQGNCNLLWDLLKMKGIDSISSQHAFANPSQKITGSFQHALNGIAALGYSLQVVWTMLNIPVTTAEQLEHYIVRLAKWLSLHPAQTLNLDNKRGSIEKGKFADLIIWNPREKFTVSEDYFYRETSPLVGQELLGCIKEVYLRGKAAYGLEDEAFGQEIIQTL